jgi:hypothetical protein
MVSGARWINVSLYRLYRSRTSYGLPMPTFCGTMALPLFDSELAVVYFHLITDASGIGEGRAAQASGHPLSPYH